MINKISQRIGQISHLPCTHHNQAFIEQQFLQCCHNRSDFDTIRKIIDMGVINLAEGCYFLLKDKQYDLVFDILTHYGQAYRNHLINSSVFSFFYTHLDSLHTFSQSTQNLALFELMVSLMTNHTVCISVNASNTYYGPKNKARSYDSIYNEMLFQLLSSLRSIHPNYQYIENHKLFIRVLAKKKFPVTPFNAERIKDHGLEEYFPRRLNRQDKEPPRGLAHNTIFRPGVEGEIRGETNQRKFFLLKDIREGFNLPASMSRFIAGCFDDISWNVRMPNHEELIFLASIAHKPHMLKFFEKYYFCDQITRRITLLKTLTHEMQEQNHQDEFNDVLDKDIVKI